MPTKGHAPATYKRSCIAVFVETLHAPVEISTPHSSFCCCAFAAETDTNAPSCVLMKPDGTRHAYKPHTEMNNTSHTYKCIYTHTYSAHCYKSLLGGHINACKFRLSRTGDTKCNAASRCIHLAIGDVCRVTVLC